MDNLIDAYAKAALVYAERLYDELDGKPFDVRFLRDGAARWRRAGAVCDLGCGPGHVSGFLADQGCDVLGLDLSPAMIDVARSRRDDVKFATADMLKLEYIDSFAAIVSFYSIVHFEAAARLGAFARMPAALVPGGELALAFHIAEGGVEDKVHVEDWWETGATLDFYLHPVEAVTHDLRSVGFESIRVESRAPYGEDVEAQTRRAYVLARKPN